MTSITSIADVTPLWRPSPERKAQAVITAFESWLQCEQGLEFDGYEQLWRWSVDEPEAFWRAILGFFDLPMATPPLRMLEGDMPKASWFEGARLNFVDQALRHTGLTVPAIVYESEAGGTGEVSWETLRRQVGALASALQGLGVQPGDRVAGYLPNIPQAVVAFLAAASLGAVWSLCAPDMGPVSVGDRFSQITPKVLVATDGYRFAGKPFDRRAPLGEILDRLPSITGVVWVPHLDPLAGPPAQAARRTVVSWTDAIAVDAPLRCEALPPDHPLWILYSSGTTGLPKPIVHGHGGVLANGMVNMVLHNDLKPGVRVLWAVNTSWMVWNAHVMGLLGGATLVLYDGSVTGAGPEPDWAHLWKLAGRHRVNVFGVGAAIHHAFLKADIVPRELADLSALQTVCSTGSPLSPEAYRWLYAAVKEDLWLNIVSGGTDITGGFLVGLPTLPVRMGEMQCRVLGTHVEAWSDDGRPLMDEVGELVCVRPIPSMPLYFWGDADGSRYRESYFDSFRDTAGRPVWRQGDWLQLISRPEAVGGIIYGRSDATINRQGVRMGTAEFYRVVEALEEVVDSLVVDLEYLGRPSYLGLFVQLRPGLVLDEALRRRMRQGLRSSLSARHVPDEILQVDAIPKTITGKKLELPVKKLMLGHALEKVVKRDALAQPESIDWFVSFAEEHLRRVQVVPGIGS
ncbi:acetoacetate--CoA ligase [Variovorax sp. J31P207]|uniref:acetoacetate--CoA ligase n=1 Tax=Variovorax sp. J31P207 TaxID=3053510 RepID=UPI0025791C82|nr:acetoacetate--CoA ligase [Variovorax sp. J31P207]MDM0066985.1 acetoacetate--CoA ligase [Variovorax sp. J31P207]